ncbi:MAG TPA: ATP-binding protein [Bryobacteraceae bacterium]|nr:ATP-binding protein [Bryobacteraceae bacterium]
MSDREHEALPEEASLLELAEKLYGPAPCGYVTTGASGNLLNINQTLLGWLGYVREELQSGVRLVDLLTPGGRLFYETHLALLLNAQQSVDEIALDFVCKDGSVLPTLVNARQTRDTRTESVLNRWAVFKATVRRLYERELLGARNLFETTLSSIADAVVSTDDRGVITFINGVAAELAGWDPDLAIGNPIEDVLVLVREDTGERIENPIRDALRTGAKVGLENHTVLVSAQGRTFVLDDTAAPIFDEDGSISGAVIVFRDVTQRREDERKLQEAYRQLEESAAELRRSNEDLSQFAYVASHDLRSPLNTVSLFSQLLRRRYSDKLGADGTQLLQQIESSTKRMGALIENLLEFAMLSSKRDYSTEPIDAETALKIVVENLHSVITESDAVIEWTSLPKVGMDDTSLTQLFQNLIANAIRYRSSATPHVRISAQREVGYWHFRCQDNGVGIGAEHYESIFEPFKRLHGNEFPGSGIGLALCKKIVQRYGGQIWVESKVGEGSTFHFTVPVATGG